MKKQSLLITLTIVLLTLLIVGTGCASKPPAGAVSAGGDDGGADGLIHVAADTGDDLGGNGTEDNPYASIAYAVTKLEPGGTLIVHDGTYAPFMIDSTVSGTAKSPSSVRAASGETPVIKPPEDGTQTPGIHLHNASYVTIAGLTVEGGDIGILVESTPGSNSAPLEEISIEDCTVHGIRGTHGICVYARDDVYPITGLVMRGCEVYDCACGSSESTVLNGNIDGFEIADNVIHENNNIGIDMIGFEGTAKHPAGSHDGNEFDADYVRNGTCHDNVVYGISTKGNAAYREDGTYDLCAGGIYVDGGQNIEIYNNFVFCCDIGIEVATEHSPDDNPLFKVTGIAVHDNVIAGCSGWCGICLGGYEADLGYTEDCRFFSNTLIDNPTQIAVQRSRNNSIYANLLVGGENDIEYNTDIRAEDLTGNRIEGNATCSLKEWDWTSRPEGCGSAFIPPAEYLTIYDAWQKR